VPTIEGPVALAELAGHPGLVLADRGGLTASELPAPPGGSWLVVVGPEGGFDDSERELLAGAPTLSVGSHVLRAETAALAVAAALAGRRIPEQTGYASQNDSQDSPKNVPE
jgi:16S rRNA (uracil1498-N3)-methyltransferase